MNTHNFLKKKKYNYLSYGLTMINSNEILLSPHGKYLRICADNTVDIGK